MDNWKYGRIAPIIFPLCTNSYVFKMTCVDSAKHFKETGW